MNYRSSDFIDHKKSKIWSQNFEKTTKEQQPQI